MADIATTIRSPILGLSLLEIAALLEIEVPHRTDNNYYRSEEFRAHCKRVKGSIDTDSYYERPQYLLNDHFYPRFSPVLERRISRDLHKIRNAPFANQLHDDIDWITERQADIVKYLCGTQERYLTSGNPLDLQNMTSADIRRHIDYDQSTANRLLQGLTIRLPNHEVIFAKNLVPGNGLMGIKIRYALDQLKGDIDYYESEWKNTSQELAAVISQKFGLEVSERTVRKYWKD